MGNIYYDLQKPSSDGEAATMSSALALKGGTMEKYMCYAVLVIGPLMFLLCLVDIIVGIPFGGGPFLLPDIFCLLASGIITYLGFSAFKDLK